MSEKLEKHFTYEAKNGKKYKVLASHFLGNVGDTFGHMFTIVGPDGEFSFVVRVPRSLALKKWKLPNRTEEEKALILIGGVLVKKELDRGNEQDKYQINFAESSAKDTLHKTLQALEN